MRFRITSSRLDISHEEQGSVHVPRPRLQADSEESEQYFFLEDAQCPYSRYLHCAWRMALINCKQLARE